MSLFTNNRNLKVVAAVLFTSVMMVSFQNCGGAKKSSQAVDQSILDGKFYLKDPKYKCVPEGSGAVFAYKEAIQISSMNTLVEYPDGCATNGGFPKKEVPFDPSIAQLSPDSQKLTYKGNVYEFGAVAPKLVVVIPAEP